MPDFKSEDQERKFWAKHDASDYFDWQHAVQPKLTQLKPSTQSISLRLPLSLLEEIKVLANQRDVPYQSLMKIYLAERIDRERGRKAS
ncbi:MAG: BrnA antitoxin family protein [Deltaproteobacteria bacterium]